MTTLRFATDEDCLLYEPNMEQVWPRQDLDGTGRNNWDTQHRLAMREIARVMQAKKGTAERFELGQIGLRDQKRLAEPAACLALHFMFIAADTQGDADGWFKSKAAHYWQYAKQMLDDLAETIDYDSDYSGAVDPIERDQPFPNRLIRG